MVYADPVGIIACWQSLLEDGLLAHIHRHALIAARQAALDFSNRIHLLHARFPATDPSTLTYLTLEHVEVLCAAPHELNAVHWVDDLTDLLDGRAGFEREARELAAVERAEERPISGGRD